MTLGAASNKEVEEIEKAIDEEEDAAAAAARRGQILWVRGLSRLQHQVCDDHSVSHLLRPTCLLTAMTIGFSLYSASDRRALSDP